MLAGLRPFNIRYRYPNIGFVDLRPSRLRRYGFDGQPQHVPKG